MILTDIIKQIYEEAGINGFQRLSEADTCERIITRLLREVAGYHFADYSSQETDAARGRPDYTVLPGTDHTWYLEAKAWNVPLSDGEAAQAVSYVNSQGKRWAVLTNGKEWRLYDNHILGVPAAEKLQAEAIYPDFASIERFLSAISKQSITSGKLEAFALRESIAQKLEVGLQNPDSTLVKALAEELKANTPNGRQVIADFFNRKNYRFSNAETQLLSETVSTSSPVEQEKFDEGSLVSFNQIYNTSKTPSDDPPNDEWIPFTQLILNANSFTGTRPFELQLDQLVLQVSEWKIAFLCIIKWVDKQGKLPEIPFPPQRGCFIDNESHGMREPKSISLSNDRAAFVETNSSTVAKIVQIEKLCEAAKISLDRIRFRIHFPKRRAT